MRAIDREHNRDLFTRGDETRVVMAETDPEGKLVVKVCTYSMGHAGVYGLVFSSGPPGPGEIENAFGADGNIAQVAPGWWRVSDYSQ